MRPEDLDYKLACRKEPWILFMIYPYTPLWITKHMLTELPSMNSHYIMD